MGVQVFWCISGYIFSWKYLDAIANRAVSAREFFVLRFSRLYPLHFVTLIIVTILQSAYIVNHGYFFVYQENDGANFLSQLFFASSWMPGNVQSFNGPIWSISLEVIAYVLFFFVHRYWGSALWVCVAVVAICGVAKWFKVPHLVFDCIAFFYAGVIAEKISQPRSKGAKTFLGIASWIFIVGTPLLAHTARLGERKYIDFFILITYCAALAYAFAEHFRVPSVTHKWIERAGNLTYSSYLVHFPLSLTIALVFSVIGQEIPYYNPWFFLAYMTATLAIANLVFRQFEMPSQRYFRTRFLRR